MTQISVFPFTRFTNFSILGTTLQLLFASTLGDVFLHIPRGSNNRLNEARNARENGNRLFDSQNNANGGYYVADKTDQPATTEDGQHKAIYFQSGETGISELAIEWWNQHGCGKKNGDDANWVDCQIVLQYMCQDSSISTFKNGINTETPGWSTPANGETFEEKTERKTDDQDETPESGEHETWEYYDACYARDRNRGLFVADQNRQTNRGATRTRQNPAGTRRGYECPEERDFYPYWHPTPWTDIAVLTSQTNNCQYYQSESSNRKPKHECVEYYDDEFTRKHASTANNAADCTLNGGNWTAFHNYLEIVPNIISEYECEQEAARLGHTFGEEFIWAVPYLDGVDRHLAPEPKCLVTLPEVECEKAPWSRANHLGNTKNDDLPNYKWKLPHFHYLDEPKECILRIRYNISSNDYPEDFDGNQAKTYYPYQHLVNDPVVELYENLQLQLAIDTAQIARVFQDRTHIFQIHPRPTNLPDSANLYNIGVRGRRGNIQQTFPALEYDFSQNSLTLSSEDYVHIQWEGSNSNAENQAGEGRDQTDRHNMVSMDERNWNIPQGNVVGDDLKLFTVERENDENEIYEYRELNNVDIFDARHLCRQYGMELPEPKDAEFNEALREFWTVDGEFKGMILLGMSDENVEGEWRYTSNNRLIDYTNWSFNNPNNGGNKANQHYGVMYSNGKWDDIRSDQKTGAQICIKPYVPVTPVESVSMFQSAEWVWSSMNSASNSVLESNENLIIQMASSGFYGCKTGCNNPVENANDVLNTQLNNAPASFHGNIMKFPAGQYYYMCTRNNNFSNRAQKGNLKIVN